MAPEEPTATVEEFFADCPSCSLDSVSEQLQGFFKHHTGPDGRLVRPVACVTSGGTAVPLERNCVRFIDNFSAGTRGAMSTEQFLKAGYAVVFLTRTGSIQPFTQDLPLTETVPLLQSLLALDDLSSSSSPSSASTDKGRPGYRLAEPAAGRVAGILARVAEVQQSQLLLTIPYTNIFEYLQYLRAIGSAARPFGPQVAFYLAAAVSDFYIPWSGLVEHKIQSSEGPLALHLHKVPKMLHSLRHEWAPASLVVSFKLETDERILLAKATAALDRYHVHAVVANLLHTRKDRVLVVQQQQQKEQQQQAVPADAAAGAAAGAAAAGVTVTQVLRPPDEPHIERRLVEGIVALHSRFIQQQQQQQQ